MCKGKPTNTIAIALLNTDYFKRMGHQEASDRLKAVYGIKLNKQGVCHIRIKHSIEWVNMKVGTKYVAEMRKLGLDPSYSELLSRFNITPCHAERLATWTA